MSSNTVSQELEWAIENIIQAKAHLQEVQLEEDTHLVQELLNDAVDLIYLRIKIPKKIRDNLYKKGLTGGKE